MAKIAYADVTRPNGGLGVRMFRDYTKDEFDSAIANWILDAASKVKRTRNDYDTATDDALEVIKDAEKAWVYHQGYLSLASLAANLPQQASEVNLSASYQNPAKENRALAAQWLETFKELMPNAVIVLSGLSRRRSSSAVFETDF